MKENNTKVVVRKVVNDFWLFVQFLLTALLLIFALMWAFTGASLAKDLLNLILGLVFMVMGYNNYRVYKRKMLTGVYVVIGLYFLITCMIGIF